MLTADYLVVLLVFRNEKTNTRGFSPHHLYFGNDDARDGEVPGSVHQE